MGRTRYKPAYDLSKAKDLARQGSMMLSRRPTKFLAERYSSVGTAALEIFSAIKPEDFYKSIELDNRPGKWADVYQEVEYDGIGWYVKFFIEDDGAVVLVWSMNYDGAMH